jgi:chitodextrinase
MKKTTKNLFLGLGLSLLGTVANAQDGLEKIIVEKYYISTAADSIGSQGVLPVGSVTYRVYADMLPGYKFQALYGNSDHALKINTTTSFFNNEDRGATTANAIASAQLKNNTVALDSWFSVGASATGQFGVLKSEDNGATNLLTLNTLLKNNAAAMGIALTAQDGNQAGTPEAVTFVGIDPANGIFDAVSQFGKSFTTSDGAISALSGATGPTAENRVLLGQFTTDGTFSFEFNIQIGTPTPGVSQKYVVSNPVNGEKTIPSLKYESNFAPTVTLTAPVNGTKYMTGDLVTITANATDKDGSVSQVEFFVDGKSVGVDMTAPYAATYPSIVGQHTITAIAKDNKADSTVSEMVAITVADNQAPTVEVAVAATAMTGDMVAITASAADVDGTVAQVEFFVDNVSVGTDTNAPFSINWNAVVGKHTVKAIATDNKGLTGTSKDSTILVKDNIAPEVVVSTPASAMTGDNVTISATATDSDGTVASVEFFVDNVSIGTDATAPYSVSYTTTVGKHKVKAVATDNLGLKGTSKEDSIVVVNNQAPFVSISTPKTAISGDEVTFTATAMDSDGTVELVEFYVDNVKVGSDASAPYTYKWTATTGSHQVKAVATDNKGLYGNSSDSIIVVTENAAPTLTLIVDSIANTNDSVVISANSTDADGTVKKIEFFIDNVLIATDTVAPYVTTWKATKGAHSVKVIATDNKGLTTTKIDSIVVTDKNVGLASINSAIQTEVYPNPAKTELSIVASENAMFEITDISGKVVVTNTVLNANAIHKISVSELNAGVYIVRIFNNNYSKTERVVINN